MNTLSLRTRLVAATTAVIVTLVLFSGVDSLSEPQRSLLIAKTQPMQLTPSTRNAQAVAMAPMATPSR